jgi:hypothetical protein
MYGWMYTPCRYVCINLWPYPVPYRTRNGGDHGRPRILKRATYIWPAELTLLRKGDELDATVLAEE